MTAEDVVNIVVKADKLRRQDFAGIIHIQIYFLTNCTNKNTKLLEII